MNTVVIFLQQGLVLTSHLPSVFPILIPLLSRGKKSPPNVRFANLLATKVQIFFTIFFVCRSGTRQKHGEVSFKSQRDKRSNTGG